MMSSSGNSPSKNPSSSSSSSSSPPKAFLCPISNSLMADPIITTTGHSFDLPCIESCKDLNYIPPCISSSSRDEFLTFRFSPNDDLKSSILAWCDQNGHTRPIPIPQDSARRIIERLVSDGNDQITNKPHPLETKILTGLKELEASRKEWAIETLVGTILGSKDNTISLCTSRIVSALIPCLVSSHPHVQIGSTSSILMFSEIESNRAKLVQWGIVPHLLNVLEIGFSPARAKAAVSIRNLAYHEENRVYFGSTNVIPRLLENFFENPIHEVRKESGIALCYLSLCAENLAVLENMGLAQKLLGAAVDKSSKGAVKLQPIAMVIMCCLATTSRGLKEMIDCGVVEEMLRMIRDGEKRDKDCLNVLYRICKGDPSTFMVITMAMGGEAVLASVKREWGEEERGTAKKVLGIMRTHIRIPKRKPFRPRLLEITEEAEDEEQGREEEEQSLINNNRRQRSRGCCGWFNNLLPIVAQFLASWCRG